MDESPLLEGNLAKQRVQRRLVELLSERPDARILDLGCVGPQPLAMWRYVAREHGSNPRLTGVDVAGIDRAIASAKAMQWSGARFVTASAYELTRRLPGESFDIVVSTQVLEHIRHIDRYFAQLAGILAPGGVALLTMDSGHHRRPISTVRRVGKWLAVRAGLERYHEKGVRDDEVAAAAARVDLRVVETRHYNINPLKWVHNHGIAAARKDEFAETWYRLEEIVNDDPAFIADNKGQFLGVYAELARGV